jgi:hypothetical protein
VQENIVDRIRKGFVTLGLLVVTLGITGPSMAADAVDLREAAALENLRHSNPAHFAMIQGILKDLAEKPERVEGDWLQTNFDARDVELSGLVLKTSYPPRQLLRFNLDDTRYTLDVVRRDLTAKPTVLR